MTKKLPSRTRKFAKPAKRPKTSEGQAAAVLRKHAERLRKRGAHAMGITSKGSEPFVEVYVPEDFDGTLPSTIGATVKGRKLDVRVKATRAPRFKPEKL